MINTDIVVVGAGPTGLIAARESAKKGRNVVVFEEHKEIGIPCHCAGLLSVKGLTEIGVPTNDFFIQNRLRGARFYSPSGLSFTVERKEAVACVVDRTKFEKFLAREASLAGVDIRLQSRVQRITRHNDQVVVSGSWGSTTASIIVDAEGVGSRFVKEMGLTPLKSEGILSALQFELADVDVDSEYVEIYVGEKIAPGFFAWVIPLTDDSARVGLACKNVNPKPMLESFIKNRFSKFKQVSIRPGLIVVCGPIPRTFSDSFVVVGDAAGQVKPTTGGGVILGGICASIAGKVVSEAVKKGKSSGRYLKRYERLWKQRLRREFRVTCLVREIANRLSDRTIDKIFKIIIEKNLQREFSFKGDMDFQASLLLGITKKRDIFRTLLTTVPDILRYKTNY